MIKALQQMNGLWKIKEWKPATTDIKIWKHQTTLKRYTLQIMKWNLDLKDQNQKNEVLFQNEANAWYLNDQKNAKFATSVFKIRKKILDNIQKQKLQPTNLQLGRAKSNQLKDKKKRDSRSWKKS